MTQREALKLALEALERCGSESYTLEREAIAAIKEVLAQPEQEPVATVQCINGVTIGYLDVMQPVGTKLYTTSPQRTWVGLTDEGVDEMWERTGDYDSFANAIEAKLKEKNHG